MRSTWRALPASDADAPGALLRLDAGETIAACITTRAGGRSTGALSSLNLSAKAGDDPAAVRANRRRVLDAIAPDARWIQGEQVHGGEVAEVDDAGDEPVAGVDALVTGARGLALAILVADCVPVLIVDRARSRIAVAHAGWRGLVAGVLERTVAMLGGSDLAAYVGPSIGPCCFEVGDEVAAALTDRFDASVRRPRPDGTDGNPHADLWRASVLALRAAGIGEIGLAAACTRCEPHRWYSHRAGSAGRQALVAVVR